MSDFGATISIVKKDGKSFSSSEKQQIQSELENIIINDELVNSLGEIYNHEIIEVYDPEPTLFVQLSEHYYGGSEEEDEEAFDFVKNTEIEDVNHIVALFKKQFPEYDYVARVEEW